MKSCDESTTNRSEKLSEEFPVNLGEFLSLCSVSVVAQIKNGVRLVRGFFQLVVS